MYSINEVTVVTPAALVATALLSHRKRGMTRESLLEACETFMETLEKMGARVAHQLRVGDGRIREDTIDEALALFLDARLIVAHDTGPEPIYTIDSERRIALEYYQNTVIHFFVPRALVAVGLLVDKDDWVDTDRLNDRVQQLSRLFKHEFIFRTDATFDEIFSDTIREMAEDGEVRRAMVRFRPLRGSSGNGYGGIQRCCRRSSRATFWHCAALKSFWMARSRRRIGTSARLRSVSKCTSLGKSSGGSHCRS